MPTANEYMAEPDAIRLLGVRIHLLTVNDLVARICASAITRQRVVVAYVNAHGLNLAYEQPRLRDFYNCRAGLVFCDGFGVKWGARLAGLPAPHRYTPPDWIDLLCQVCTQQGQSLYLLGGQAGAAERAAAALVTRHSGLHIAGTHHGYFDKQPESAQNEAVVRAINAAASDVLLVGFGMPAQEYWLDANWDRLHASVAITVGALFGYLNGDVRRAPHWMTDHGLEWLGRLMAEPGRLWQRYLIGNPTFLARVAGQRLGLLRIE